MHRFSRFPILHFCRVSLERNYSILRSLYYKLVIPLIAIAGVYVALFALSSFMHDNRMDAFENKAIRIYAQLIEQNPKRAVEVIPSVQEIVVPEGPNILIPSSVFFSIFYAKEVNIERAKALKMVIVLFKDDLSGLNLSKMDLSGEETDLSGAKLSNADLRGVNLSHVDLSDANLSGAKLTDANLRGVNLNNAVLTDADLSRADLREVNLTNANLSRAVLRESIISSAELGGVNFFFADLSGVIFRESRLVGADLSGVTLFHADLIRADLSRAKLYGADLNSADLRFANLSSATGLNQDQLDRGIVDERTKLPEGLKRSKK